MPTYRGIFDGTPYVFDEKGVPLHPIASEEERALPPLPEGLGPEGALPPTVREEAPETVVSPLPAATLLARAAEILGYAVDWSEEEQSWQWKNPQYPLSGPEWVNYTPEKLAADNATLFQALSPAVPITGREVPQILSPGGPAGAAPPDLPRATAVESAVNSATQNTEIREAMLLAVGVEGSLTGPWGTEEGEPNVNTKGNDFSIGPWQINFHESTGQIDAQGRRWIDTPEGRVYITREQAADPAQAARFMEHLFRAGWGVIAPERWEADRDQAILDLVNAAERPAEPYTLENIAGAQRGLAAVGAGPSVSPEGLTPQEETMWSLFNARHGMSISQFRAGIAAVETGLYPTFEAWWDEINELEARRLAEEGHIPWSVYEEGELRNLSAAQMRNTVNWGISVARYADILDVGFTESHIQSAVQLGFEPEEYAWAIGQGLSETDIRNAKQADISLPQAVYNARLEARLEGAEAEALAAFEKDWEKVVKGFDPALVAEPGFGAYLEQERVKAGEAFLAAQLQTAEAEAGRETRAEMSAVLGIPPEEQEPEPLAPIVKPVRMPTHAELIQGAINIGLPTRVPEGAPGREPERLLKGGVRPTLGGTGGAPERRIFTQPLGRIQTPFMGLTRLGGEAFMKAARQALWRKGVGEAISPEVGIEHLAARWREEQGIAPAAAPQALRPRRIAVPEEEEEEEELPRRRRRIEIQRTEPKRKKRRPIGVDLGLR